MDLFKTPKQLPFLHYTYHWVDANTWGNGATEKQQQMSIDLGPMPFLEQPSLDDLWTTEVNENIQKSGEHQLLVAANILRSAVAFRSRRAVANILIVQNQEKKDWLDTNATFLRQQACTVIVDPTLQPNEIRATYWKLIFKKDRIGSEVVCFSDIPIAVDGGIQISPEGFSAIQKSDNISIDYHCYFRRGFM